MQVVRNLCASFFRVPRHIQACKNVVGIEPIVVDLCPFPRSAPHDSGVRGVSPPLARLGVEGTRGRWRFPPLPQIAPGAENEHDLIFPTTQDITPLAEWYQYTLGQRGRSKPPHHPLHPLLPDVGVNRGGVDRRMPQQCRDVHPFGRPTAILILAIFCQSVAVVGWETTTH